MFSHIYYKHIILYYDTVNILGKCLPTTIVCNCYTVIYRSIISTVYYYRVETFIYSLLFSLEHNTI